MTHPVVSFPTLSSQARAACVTAAVACSACISVGLLALFASASSQPWLIPTPQLLQAQAQCDALRDVTARADCSHQLVARTLAAGPYPAHVAAR